MSTREYPTRPLVGIGIVMLKGDSVLLARRGKPPGAGTWSLPGGAQKLGETAVEAARRELLEETGLVAGPMMLAAHVDSIHRDDDARVQFHYTILDFACAWCGGEPRPGGDVTEARFAEIGALAEFDLWSEAHRVIAEARVLISSAAAANSMCPRD